MPIRLSLPPQLERKLRRAIDTNELGPAADFIVSRALPCVRFTDVGEVRAQRVGSTRFGGDPDLPEGESWPQGTPWEHVDPQRTNANFLAQIDLATLPRWDGSPLPEAGLLSFFLTRVPEATGSLHVRLIPPGTPLRRVPTPDSSTLVDAYNDRFHPRKVKAALGVSLPAHDEPFRERIEQLCEASDEQTGEEYLNEALIEMDSNVAPGGDWFAQLLGYAVGSVAYEPDHHRRIAHERLGLSGNSWEDFPEADEKRLRRETARWRLLLHLGSHGLMGACWSDAGYLFSFIKENALAKLNFRDVPATIYH